MRSYQAPVVRLAFPVLALAALVTLVEKPTSAQSNVAAGAKDSYAFENIPRGFDYPAEEYKLIAYVDGENRQAIREHAWNLWAGLTAPSRSVWHGQRLPVYETWYSSQEVFDDHFKNPQLTDEARVFRRRFEVPVQALHMHQALGTKAAAVMAFVKYNQAARDFIWSKRYYLRATLDETNRSFDQRGSPIEQRQVDPFPQTAVSLKLVYWLVKNPDSPQSQHGLTAFPYWDPSYPPPPNGQPPTHLTWSKCVAVDPSGKYPVGSKQKVDCNGTVEKPRYVDAEVVGLDRFYAYQLRTPEEVEDAKLSSKNVSGSGPHEQEAFVTDPGQVPELNDYIVLCGMHLTTKEMDNWTFQTFWWSPTPDSPPNGDFRPPSVKGAWANYQMCTAYSMSTPRTASGGPPICFNPYLESDLGPMTSYKLGDRTYPADPMAGTRSNCMNCHAKAAWPFQPPASASAAADAAPAPPSSNYGRIFNDGYIAPNDSYFTGLTKTDFLWSLIFLSQPKQQ